MSEMECTAQAFEEMQEQNIRLLMQLKVVGVGRVVEGGGMEEDGMVGGSWGEGGYVNLCEGSYLV